MTPTAVRLYGENKPMTSNIVHRSSKLATSTLACVNIRPNYLTEQRNEIITPHQSVELSSNVNFEKSYFKCKITFKINRKYIVFQTMKIAIFKVRSRHTVQKMQRSLVRKLGTIRYLLAAKNVFSFFSCLTTFVYIR